MDALPIAMIM